MTDSKKLKKIINSSGFPLQIGIENLVNETSSLHGWHVSSKEHAWKNNNTNSEGFIDLILRNSHDTAFLAVTCKSALDSTWIFLQPSKQESSRRLVKAWVSRIVDGETKYFDWMHLAAEPTTPQSEFCVVAGQDSKSRPMLERTAADLIEATEGLAYEEYSFLMQASDEFRMYFNVIVTTAEIKVCRFNQTSVSLTNGELDAAEFSTIPYLRFRKQFSTKEVSQDFISNRGYHNFLRAKKNTVFVINSGHILQFLRNFEIDHSSIRRFI